MARSTPSREFMLRKPGARRWFPPPHGPSSAGQSARLPHLPAMRDDALSLLRELTEAHGVPGSEDAVRAIFRRRLDAAAVAALTAF